MVHRKPDIEQPYTLTREEKAHKIAFTKDAISRIDENTYQVRSQSGNGSYVVVQNNYDWKCTCHDHQYRSVKCKHIIAIEYSQELRREVQETAKTVISAISMLVCKFCNSANIVKDAIRHNSYGDVQRYKCKECCKRFSFNIGFEKKQASPQIITTAMQLYFTGESLRNVQKFVKLQGLEISHVTVYNWINRYVELM